jgi:hypothetical protein
LRHHLGGLRWGALGVIRRRPYGSNVARRSGGVEALSAQGRDQGVPIGADDRQKPVYARICVHPLASGAGYTSLAFMRAITDHKRLPVVDKDARACASARVDPVRPRFYEPDKGPPTPLERRTARGGNCELIQNFAYSLLRRLERKPIFSENAKQVIREPTTISGLKLALPPNKEPAPVRIVLPPQERHNVGATTTSERTRM